MALASRNKRNATKTLNACVKSSVMYFGASILVKDETLPSKEKAIHRANPTNITLARDMDKIPYD